MNWADSETEIYEQALASVEACNKRIAKVYLLVQKEISDELKQFYLSVNPSWSAQYQAQRLSDIFETINMRLSAFTGFTTDRIESAFLGQYQDTFNNYAYNLCDYYSTPGSFPLLPFSQVDESVIKAALNEKVGEYSFLDSMADKQATLQQQLREAVAISITKGEGIVDLVNRLQEAFDSGISRYVATARTEMLKSYSLAQEEATRQARGEMGITFSYQWLGFPDGRERPSHLALNNTFAKIDKDGNPYFIGGGCRGSSPRLFVGLKSAAMNVNCRCRRLNIPMEIDEEMMNSFPTIDGRPDFNTYLKIAA